MGLDVMILVFWTLSFKPAFSQFLLFHAGGAASFISATVLISVFLGSTEEPGKTCWWDLKQVTDLRDSAGLYNSSLPELLLQSNLHAF